MHGAFWCLSLPRLQERTKAHTSGTSSWTWHDWSRSAAQGPLHWCAPLLRSWHVRRCFTCYMFSCLDKRESTPNPALRVYLSITLVCPLSAEHSICKCHTVVSTWECLSRTILCPLWPVAFRIRIYRAVALAFVNVVRCHHLRPVLSGDPCGSALCKQIM